MVLKVYGKVSLPFPYLFCENWEKGKKSIDSFPRRSRKKRRGTLLGLISRKKKEKEKRGKALPLFCKALFLPLPLLFCFCQSVDLARTVRGWSMYEQYAEKPQRSRGYRRNRIKKNGFCGEKSIARKIPKMSTPPPPSF